MSTNKSNFKLLYLLRHAKSSWADHSMSDFERPLNKRGIQQASQIAAILASKEPRPQVIISSPANRAFSTAKTMAVALGSDKSKIGSDKRIYEANIQTLMYLIQELDDDLESVMLVGHNPGFSHLVNTLSRQKVAPLPTCSLIQLRLDINQWSELEAECAELLSADAPKREDQ
ncbi:SixA phosphatase family protein [Leucothrix pacifica]|uniref:Phosphohistidine phosphatase n=1 Tax=Leucothrix pacifica TaxID=1247513 RepID=A0A317CQL8_9GAMM|nr:histidine phosphatase family protein [Leucothrix pacifica]PWR00402.1 hypothetical protein DKW60_02290 [Leucothrix pacifica]